ncbi:uncharacterized protein LOC136091257 isoform X2 [Hydra vulgaris]|uniref:Uncharacterized protein LOC136091257 isoform X2 n=1 Tax=Hydra vulgaris TaxID=6087 RepID=A0ABM4DJI2_HYDVU
MTTEAHESCASNYFEDNSCDFVARKKNIDLDIIKKENEKKELKIVTERNTLDDKILDLEKQASLLDSETVKPCTSSAQGKRTEVVKDSSWNDFMAWRRQNPGPKTRRAFQFWVRNGSKDLPGFRWKMKGPEKNKNINKIINNYF